MASRRILIAWELGGHLGHLGRLLPVAEQLRIQGNIVLWAVRHLNKAARMLDTSSWQLVQAPTPAPTRQAQRPATCHADVLLLDGFADTDNLLARLAAWHSLFKLFQPDAVLADYAPLATYAAHSAGIHVVPLGNGFETPPVNAPQLPCFQPWNQGAQAGRQHAEQALQTALTRLASTTAGRHAPQTLAALYPPERSALCIHPPLDHFPRPSGHYVGPLWADLQTGPAFHQANPPSNPPQWPARAGPKVLCYLHLQRTPTDVLFRQLAACNTIVLSPQAPDSVATSAANAGVHLITHPVPITGLMHEADAVITQGGTGLMGRALAQGKPMLLLPETAEQLILSRQLFTRHLALATTRTQDKDTLTNKVQLLLSPQSRTPALHAYAAQYQSQSVSQAVQRVIHSLERF